VTDYLAASRKAKRSAAVLLEASRELVATAKMLIVDTRNLRKTLLSGGP
jgi:hypothetical protein